MVDWVRRRLKVMTINIRVRAKTDNDSWRIITVEESGSPVSCDCGGFDGIICSHIDAVLICEERAMVHTDDLTLADQAT